MYSKEFRESLNAVEAAREANIALEPARMTAEEKEKLLKQYHPDYLFLLCFCDIPSLLIFLFCVFL